jgi:hypothetical protein
MIMSWTYRGKTYANHELPTLLLDVYTVKDYLYYLSIDPHITTDDISDIMNNFNDYYLAMVDSIAADMIYFRNDIYDYGITYKHD